MQLNLNITRVVVVRGSGTDKILIQTTGQSTFPELEENEPGSYPPCYQIDCRRGYAEQWLNDVGITEFQVINRK